MRTSQIQPDPRPRVPNERELAVLRLIAQGLDHFEIAKRLFISPDTSKARLKNLRAKLDAPTAAVAIYKAFKRHLLE